jgi:hypothetical protein
VNCWRLAVAAWAGRARMAMYEGWGSGIKDSSLAKRTASAGNSKAACQTYCWTLPWH